mgnify:CR=1 FL=1
MLGGREGSVYRGLTLRRAVFRDQVRSDHERLVLPDHLARLTVCVVELSRSSTQANTQY